MQIFPSAYCAPFSLYFVIVETVGISGRIIMGESFFVSFELIFLATCTLLQDQTSCLKPILDQYARH